MGFIFILIGTTLIFSFLKYKFDSDVCFISAIIAGVALTMAIVAIPFGQYNSNKRVKEFQVRKTVIAQQRVSNVSELERVALTMEIINDNVWLSNVQYGKNHIWFNIYYSSEVMNLTPIQ